MQLRQAALLVCAALLGGACQERIITGHAGASAGAGAVRPAAVPSLAAPSVSAPDVSHAPAVAPQSWPGACEHLPFLKTYERAGALRRRGQTVEIDVDVDLHSLDCGAPDCYGHDMVLALDLEAQQERCQIVSATAAAKPVNHCGQPLGPSRPWRNTFAVVQGANLAEPGLARVQLYDAGRREALVLLGYDYYFYEQVGPSTELVLELAGEDTKPGAAYGYTSAKSRQWQYEFWRSPIAPANFAEPESLDLAAFNRWATGAGLRQNLDELARRALALPPSARIRRELHSGEPATGATLRIDQLPSEIPARRLILHFSRKACQACLEGMSGWYLWKVGAEPRP